MGVFDETDYQKNQIRVIDKIESLVRKDDLSFSTVSPVEDYGGDQRICLTGVHFPQEGLLDVVWESIIKPLKNISPNHYYYPKTNLHLTVKNVRTINDPPNFTQNDIVRAKEVFTRVVPTHKKFKVYFYRLLLFKSNLALIGTTDEELDSLILDLDRELTNGGVPDDKVYANSKHFFSNMTLARFTKGLSREFLNKVKSLTNVSHIAPYTIDSVTLLTSNAVMEDKKIIGQWNLA